ncbi:Centrosomal protein [Nymphon striatum]|nr:Centrosomal protein [Nymphon striatum]
MIENPEASGALRQLQAKTCALERFLQLLSGEIGSRIEKVIQSHLQKNKDALKSVSTKEFFNGMKQDGLINELLKILGGRAFLDYLNQDYVLPGEKASQLTLYLQFLGQKYESKSTVCVSEPDFKDTFVFTFEEKFKHDRLPRMLDPTLLLSFSEPIHLVLIETNSFGNRKLISSHYLDWRTTLSADELCSKISIELMGVGCETNIPVGIINLELSILPCHRPPVAENVLKAQLSLDHQRSAERRRLFLVYAKQWWAEYLSIRSSHEHRLVKIFAQDENGVNQFVCDFIRPILGEKIIETARESSWFVVLFSHESSFSMSGAGGKDGKEFWSNLHTFLCRRQGDHPERAVLLCSLLLGFGLNAYVCIGTKSDNSAHAWVATRNSAGKVLFWEPSNASRFPHEQLSHHTKLPCSYSTIGCLFNHKSFYANCQPTDSVALCSFELENSSKWKSMSPEAIQSATCDKHKSIKILPSTIDCIQMSNDLEEEMKALIYQRRKCEESTSPVDLGLITKFDDQMKHLLGSAIATYEADRKAGTVKNFTFSPLCNRNSKSTQCKDIVDCKGDGVKLAIGASVYSYAENVTSVWVMFSATYMSVV